MKKIRYYRAGRIRTLKLGIDPKQYELDHPDAVKISFADNEEWEARLKNELGCIEEAIEALNNID